MKRGWREDVLLYIILAKDRDKHMGERRERMKRGWRKDGEMKENI